MQIVLVIEEQPFEAMIGDSIDGHQKKQVEEKAEERGREKYNWATKRIHREAESSLLT